MAQLIEDIIAYLVGWLESLGYWGIGIGMAIESANIPLPSEIILPYGGFMVAREKLTFEMTVLVGTIGGTVGSVISYFLGLWGGRAFILRYGRYVGISQHHLGLAERWFDRYGEITVFVTRLMPIVRTFISLPAGIGRMNLLRFTVYTFAGSLIWSVFLVLVGVKLGENWQAIEPWFRRFDILIIGVSLLALAYWWYKRRRHFR